MMTSDPLEAIRLLRCPLCGAKVRIGTKIESPSITDNSVTEVPRDRGRCLGNPSHALQLSFDGSEWYPI